MSKSEEIKIAVISLGYVGLPPAEEFSSLAFGCGILNKSIDELNQTFDSTLPLSPSYYSPSLHLIFATKISNINCCFLYTETASTPINIYDFWANPEEVKSDQQWKLINAIPDKVYRNSFSNRAYYFYRP